MSKTSDSPKNPQENSSTSTDLKPLPALTNTGVTAVTVGTIIWIFGTFVLLLKRDWLIETNREHWIVIGLLGITLGLLGQVYTRHRAARIARGSKY